MNRTIRTALQHTKQRLTVERIPAFERHAELLLENLLDCSREQLYLRQEEPFNDALQGQLDQLINRRLAGEPVQHIVGWAPFYGLRLEVGAGVFIPRFDSEIIIEHLLADISQKNLPAPVRLLDLCCGSGAIGLAVVAENQAVQATLLDLDFTAIRYATMNSLKNGFADRVDIVHWDALEEFPPEWKGQFDYITANPPYIPAEDIATLHPDVRDGEPRTALTDEGDGLSFYRRWAETIPPLLKPGGRFYTECGIGQAGLVQQIFTRSLNNIGILTDLGGIERVVFGNSCAKI